MKKKKKSLLIFFVGVIILAVFVSVCSLNLLPNFENKMFYAKMNNTNNNAKLESIKIENGKLKITMLGNPSEYCVKSTRTKPGDNSLCWNKVKNNITYISIFEHKKYYVWIKDNDGNISDYLSTN